MQHSIEHGGQFAFAMPRGEGKTSLSEIALVWAALYGKRRYVVLIAAKEGKARELMKDIKTFLRHNRALKRDFPEVLYPIEAINNNARKAETQTYQGEPTEITWVANKIVLPTLIDFEYPEDHGQVYPCCIIETAGITGDIRGRHHTLTSGEIVRPDFVIVDDPSTAEPLWIFETVPTMDGVKYMKDVHVGDVVFDRHGKPCNVIAESDITNSVDCYSVLFDDGTSVIADYKHLWTVQTALQRTNARRRKKNPKRKWVVKKPLYTTIRTVDMIDQLKAEGGRNNFSIDLCDPVQFAGSSNLPLDPYTLGVWLGDGDTNSGRVTGYDETFEQLRNIGWEIGSRNYKKNGDAYSATVYGLRTILRTHGLLGRKHIPEEYWTASVEDRIALLQGLMDTDGSCSKRDGRCSFSNTNEDIIDGVLWLCRSLGIKARKAESKQKYPGAKPAWRVAFVTNQPVFRIKRKLDRTQRRQFAPDSKRKYIVDIQPAGSADVKCIKVDSEDSLFLCSNGFTATHNSAKSPEQNNQRIKVLNADILGLAGPDQRISAFMPCTIIESNDMAAQILEDPNWHGEKTAMIIEWPEDMDLWWEYNRVRLDGARAMDGGESSRKFYEDNREALEKGAKVSWEHRIRHGEITALQTAMNLFFEQGERAFYSEYQNQPLSEFANLLDIEPHMVREAANGMKAFEVPPQCQFLVAMIDVNVSSGLHYTVLASTNNMEVHCPYYGRYPEDVNAALWTRESTGGLTEAQAVFNAIIATTNKLDELVFLRGGKQMHIDMISVDCGYLMDVVFSACAVADGNLSRTKVVASRGYAQKNWRETKVVGRVADNVYRSKFDGKGPVVKHNADYWRERVHQAFLLGGGAPGSITLFGQPEVHEYYSEHICGERLLEHFQTEKDEYYNWQRVPGRKNDLLDTTVGALALFSIMGANFDGGLRMNAESSGVQQRVIEATYTAL